MNMLAFAINAAERAPLTDAVTLAGIDMLCVRTKRRLANIPDDAELAFTKDMATFPIASHTDEANRQHYEVPAEFFSLVLGAQRKYSCCYYPDATTTLDEAETVALSRQWPMPGCVMAWIFWNSAAVGVRFPCIWRADFPMRGSHPFRTQHRSVTT